MPEKPLATIMSQLHFCETDMQACMTHATHLHLTIPHTINHSGTEAAGITGSSNLATPCLHMPQSSEAVVGAVLEYLAAALPRLQEVSLGLGCGESATQAFGSRCMQLSSLEVEFFGVPAAALQDISQLLPRLSQVTFTGRESISIYIIIHVAGSIKSLGAHVVHLRQCTPLTRLMVYVEVSCPPASLDAGMSYPPVLKDTAATFNPTCIICNSQP